MFALTRCGRMYTSGNEDLASVLVNRLEFETDERTRIELPELLPLSTIKAKRPSLASPGTLIVARVPRNQSCSPFPEPDQDAFALGSPTIRQRIGAL